MYKIFFYRNKKGKSEIEDYILKLKMNNNKNNRIKLNKIISYIDKIKEYGIDIGEPFIKYIKNDIWELRPLRDRILFKKLSNNNFVFLNIFTKKTQKTPEREYEKAKRYLKDFIERGGENEK